MVGFGLQYGFADSKTFYLEVFGWPDIVLPASEIGLNFSGVTWLTGKKGIDQRIKLSGVIVSVCIVVLVRRKQGCVEKWYWKENTWYALNKIREDKQVERIIEVSVGYSVMAGFIL